jgi:EVE domain-containing protein
MPDPNGKRGNWIAVACAEHVRRGVTLGIMQVGHGKSPPLRRIAPGDLVAYYSPTETLGGHDKLQCFSAIGVVLPGEVYQADMGGGFRPFRRDVRYFKATPAPIRPLLDLPGFALSGKDWGARLRFGLVRIDTTSMRAIATAMGVGEDIRA